MSGSAKVSCCTQRHESTTAQEFLLAVRDKENNCREQLAWHGLKKDGSCGGHLRTCSPRLREQTAHRPNENLVSGWRRAVLWHWWRAGDRSVTFIEEYRITNPPSSSKLFAKSQIQTQTTRETEMLDQLSHVDYVTTNANSSQGESQLYIFEDNEAVIGMIIKGRSPTRRHVSRTHKVALGCLFDRIILDPKIQIKIVDTQNQIADMLTKSKFTRDEWNHLLRVFNIMSFSMFSCKHFTPINNPKNHVEEADAGRNTWKRGTCGCENRNQ